MSIADYVYKSQPFDHQRELTELQCEKEVFAFLMEQGTGKSKPNVDTVAYLYEEGEIRLWVIAAPNGVHTKWALEDLPLSLPDRIEHDVHIWRSDGTKRNQRGYERLLNKPGDHLRILCINTEFLQYRKGADIVEALMQKFRAFFTIDESVSIMSPDAKRTKNIIDLGGWAEFRRILTGTAVVKAPFDLYSQFYFLDWRILGDNKFVAFKSQYGEFYPPNHPFVLNIIKKNNPKVAQFVNSQLRQGIDLKDIKLPFWATARAPMILAEDANGLPKYKNLNKLRRLIEPHSYRKTKAECFDLPPKVYQTRYFSMTPEQRRFYDDIRDQFRGILEDELIIIDHKLTVQLRLHQIACGFMPTGNPDEIIPFFRNDESENPRVQAIIAELQNYDGQQIVWCRFKREIHVLKKILGDRAATYFGDTETTEGSGAKQRNKEAFISGDVQYLLGTAASGGVGHNFANASKAIFGSNTFSYYHRIQAEDRQHRHGLAEHVESVLYVDIQAEDSVDQDIVASIKMKQDLGDYMMGKPTLDTRWLYE